jgi:hypothetical protein
MIRAAAFVALASCVFACALVAGCAAPGDPAARHPVVPVAVTDLTARQYGNAFALTFTLPTRSLDHEPLAEHPAVEIYRAELLPGSLPDKKTAWRLAYTIPPEQVDLFLRGEHFEFLDVLTGEDLLRAAGSSLVYKIRTSASKTRASEDSNAVTARLYPAPDAPREVHVEVTESEVVVNWAETAVPPGASSRSYRVYRGVVDPGQESLPGDVSKLKFKTPPELAGASTSTEFRDVHFEFGTPYAYSVRAVGQFGADLVESADSAPVMVTPRDVFPPAAPIGLEITVVPGTQQAPAYVDLSWAISSEADLAGYSVYRSDAADAFGERVSTETLPSPTFRDISVVPGRRYYYRVSAVDRAGNESPRSSAVQADVP